MFWHRQPPVLPLACEQTEQCPPSICMKAKLVEFSIAIRNHMPLKGFKQNMFRTHQNHTPSATNTLTITGYPIRLTE
jgi:hypothetical protein